MRANAGASGCEYVVNCKEQREHTVKGLQTPDATELTAEPTAFFFLLLLLLLLLRPIFIRCLAINLSMLIHAGTGRDRHRPLFPPAPASLSLSRSLSLALGVWCSPLVCVGEFLRSLLPSPSVSLSLALGAW